MHGSSSPKYRSLKCFTAAVASFASFLVSEGLRRRKITMLKDAWRSAGGNCYFSYIPQDRVAVTVNKISIFCRNKNRSNSLWLVTPMFTQYLGRLFVPSKVTCPSHGPPSPSLTLELPLHQTGPSNVSMLVRTGVPASAEHRKCSQSLKRWSV